MEHRANVTEFILVITGRFPDFREHFDGGAGGGNNPHVVLYRKGLAAAPTGQPEHLVHFLGICPRILGESSQEQLKGLEGVLLKGDGAFEAGISTEMLVLEQGKRLLCCGLWISHGDPCLFLTCFG